MHTISAIAATTLGLLAISMPPGRPDALPEAEDT